GGAVGFGVWFGALGGRSPWHRRSVVAAAAAGAVAGLVVPLLGGRLMAGSLDLLAQTFPNSRLRLDQLGTLFGDAGFGTASQVATGALEGALFAACVVAAMAGFAPLLGVRSRAASRVRSTWMRRGVDSAFFGITMRSTPWLPDAVMRSGSALSGSAKRRWKPPCTRSTRA